MPTPETIQVSVTDVYGTNIEQLATSLTRRQSFTDFRVIPSTETNITFLGLNGEVIKYDPTKTHKFGGPRLIVTERRMRRWVFTEQDQDGYPAPGQPYRDEEGNIAFGREGATYARPYTLLVHWEEEVVA